MQKQLESALKVINDSHLMVPTMRITLWDLETKEIPISEHTIDDIIEFFKKIKSKNAK